MIKRIAYIKNGDVVTQLERIFSNSDDIITSGPDAFLFDFIQKFNHLPLLLLSFHQRHRRYRHKNIKAKVIYTPQVLKNKFQKIIIRISALIDQLQSLFRFKPSVIICGKGRETLWATYIVSKCLSIPFIQSRHSSILIGSPSFFVNLLTKLDNWVIKQARGVICHGPFLKSQLLKIGIPENKIFEFDIGFEDFTFPSGTITDPSNKKPRIHGEYGLFAGRIEREKGVFDLFDAFQLYMEHDLQFKIIYAGQGPHFKQLKKRITESGLSQRVLLFGSVKRNEIITLIRNARFVVTPTRSKYGEGRCMTAMESIFLGTPLIAPEFGPFPYLLKHEFNGLLYQPDSVTALGKNIQRMFSEKMLYKKTRRNAEESGKELLKPVRTFSQAISAIMANI